MIKIKKGLTLSETLISLTIASFLMIASTGILLRTNELNSKVSSISEQRSYITNVRDNLFNEISKAKFFYFSHSQGIPQDVIDELPDNSIFSTYSNTSDIIINKYNLSTIEQFNLSVPDYSSLLNLGGNLQTESNNSAPIPGEILHFSQMEVLDLIKLLNSQPTSSDTDTSFNFGYGLDSLDSSGNGKIMIRMINDCYIYPRKTKDENDSINKESHEIVVRKTRYAFQVIPDGRTSIQKYRPDIIINTSIIDKNPSLLTNTARELAWKSLYEKIAFKLLERGYKPWTEMNSNSTYVDQTISSNSIFNYLSKPSVTHTPQYIPFYYKKVIGKYISQSPMIREIKDSSGNIQNIQMSKNGIYFNLIKNVPDQEQLADIPADLIPGQKSHFITGLQVKLDFKKGFYDKDGQIKYISKSDDFSLESKNNRVYQ